MSLISRWLQEGIQEMEEALHVLDVEHRRIQQLIEFVVEVRVISKDKAPFVN